MRFVEEIEERSNVQTWGAVWTMMLEKWVSKSGKTVTYHIHHFGGQSYPVGTYRSLKAAYKDLNSFTEYKKV